MTTEPDYYAILGVAPTAEADEIRHAFRAKARRYHPDVNKEPGAARLFQLAHDAYNVLGDPEKRRAYDAGRVPRSPRASSAPPGATPRAQTRRASTAPPFSAGGTSADSLSSDFDDILSSLGATPPRPKAQPRATRDIAETATISLEEAARGVKRQVRIERDEPCSLCHGMGDYGGPRLTPCEVCHGTGFAAPGPGGKPRMCPRCDGVGEILLSSCAGCNGKGWVHTPHTLEVTIPAGIDDGQRIRLAGQGHRGALGAPPGDLYVTVRVRPHRTFSRRGDDVYSPLRLTPAQARDGARVDVPTLYGHVSLKIPPGTADGTTFRLRGQGFPRAAKAGGGKGDQFARAHITTSAEGRARTALRAWTRQARRRLGPLKRTLVKRVRAL